MRCEYTLSKGRCSDRGPSALGTDSARAWCKAPETRRQIAIDWKVMILQQTLFRAQFSLGTFSNEKVFDVSRLLE